MMNKLKSSFPLTFNTHFWGTILTNDKKKKNNLKETSGLFWKHILNTFIYCHFLILTTRPHNLSTICTVLFQHIYLLMINKLKYNQLKYLSKHIYSSSESSEEDSNPSIICLTTFFQYIYTLLKLLVDNSFNPYWEQNPS